MAAKTEQQLADSLKKLLTKKTLDRITVRDITDDCGVNRQTFYYHFHDVYDLVEWIFRQASENYMKEGVDYSNWRELMEWIITSFREDKSFIMNTYYSLDRRQLDTFLNQFLEPAVSSMAEQICGMREIDISEEDRGLVVRLITYSIIGIMGEWIGSGMPEVPAEGREKIYLIMDGTLEHALMKFDRSRVWIPDSARQSGKND